MCDFTGEPNSGLIGVLANAALLRSARSNPRYTYMTIDRDLEYGRVFAEAVGAYRVPEADTPVVNTVVEAWLIDYGAGGFLAHQRELVYRELGLDPPPRPPEGSGSIATEQVRDALRNLIDQRCSPRARWRSGRGYANERTRCESCFPGPRRKRSATSPRNASCGT